jgi:hypothetical protein
VGTVSHQAEPEAVRYHIKRSVTPVVRAMHLKSLGEAPVIIAKLRS